MKFILFALGALTMIVEFSIPRLIAPAYGNTLFSWTAIISVVLVAMTVGYYVGGKLSENSHKAEFRIASFGVASASWTILIALTGASIVESLSFLNILTGPVVTSILFALVPTFLNAAVVPLAISTYRGPAGSASGECFSISTVGSIAGVVFTGYVFLPLLGVSGTLLAGASLYFLSLIFFKPKAVGVIGLLLSLALAWFTSNRDLPENVLVDHSNGYHRIKIIETKSAHQTSRRLLLDSTIEGIAVLGKPSSYLPGITKLVDSLDNVDSVLVIGGGAFSTPRYFKDKFPHAVVDVIELDPDVVRYAEEFLELDDSVNVYVGDGRNVIRLLDKKYDLIFNDAFRGFKNIPSHLTTVEFNELIKEKLNDDGIYTINVRGYPTESYLTASLLKTLRQGFTHLYETGQSASNTITLASNHQIDFGSALEVLASEGIILTDNRAPTEMLIVADVVRDKVGF